MAHKEMTKGGIMTDSLKDLIDKGQYELAAYRLVYAVVKAQIERGSGKNGRRPRSAGVPGETEIKTETEIQI